MTGGTLQSAYRSRTPARLAGALALLLLIAWFSTGVYTVAPDELGLVRRFGRLVADRVPAGMHFALPWPIDRVETPRVTDVKRIEVGWRSLGELSSEPRRSDMLTGDENILKVMMMVQYKVSDPAAFRFRTDAPHWLVERAVESALAAKLASMPVDDVLTAAKGEIHRDTLQAAQELLDAYDCGIRLLNADLQQVDPPFPVSDAFKDVASAGRDSQRAIDDAMGYESSVLNSARGEHQQILSRAQSSAKETVDRALGEASRFLALLKEYREAPDVTRARLYLDTMERTLAGMQIVIPDGNRITIVDQPAN